MPERRPISSNVPHNRATGVRRNLFHQQLSRRPTATRENSASLENLRSDNDLEWDESPEIVIRDENGEFQISAVAASSPMQSFDDEDAGQHEAREDEKDRQRLIDAIKNLQRDRNRAPSEPTELLDAVKVNLKAKVAALAEDNWLYEPEDDTITR